MKHRAVGTAISNSRIAYLKSNSLSAKANKKPVN